MKTTEREKWEREFLDREREKGEARVRDSIKSETPDEARRRRRREYDAEVEDRALDLVQHDPEVAGDMRKAKAKAREIIGLERAYKDDPDSDNFKPETRRSRRRADSAAVTKPRARSSSTPSAGRGKRRARKAARTVVAPFGSAASAGWTFVQGALALILLFVVLRNAKAVGALFDGITHGIRKFADPTIPLIPKAGEATPARRATPPLSRQPHRSTRSTATKGGAR